MQPAKFYELLESLMFAKDKETRAQAEQFYFDYRNASPSDNFMENITLVIESSNNIEIRAFACILLRQDIEKSQETCALNRLSSPNMAQGYIARYLQAVATQPDDKLIQVIASFTLERMSQDASFTATEVFQFIQQAFTHENAAVRCLATNLIDEFSEASIKTLKRFPFDVMLFLQTALGDVDHKVARYAIQALVKIVQNRMDDQGENTIPTEVVKQITVSILKRTGMSISGGDVANSCEMMGSICDLVDYEAEDIVEIIPDCMNLLSQIMSSQVQEKIKKKAINITTTICDSCGSIRKVLQEMLFQFIQKYILPNCSEMNEEKLQNWLTTPLDYKFDDDSIESLCCDCMDAASHTLGKAVINPLLQQSITAVMQQPNNWQFASAVLCAIYSATEGISDVLKQKEVDQYVNNVLVLLGNPHPYVRFEALTCLGVVSKDFGGKIHKLHKKVIPAIVQAAKDQCSKVSVNAGNAMIDYCKGLDYEEIFDYLEIIKEMITYYWSTENMDAQISALALITSIAEKVDAGDIQPFFKQIMPSVLSSFAGLMTAIQNVPEFTQTQSNFIENILDAIATAAQVCQDLFQDLSAELMENIIIIAQRAYKQTENDIFYAALSAVQQLTLTYKEKMHCYVDRLYPLFIEVLKLSLVSSKTDVQNEGDIEFNPHVYDQQSVVLMVLSEFLDKCPSAFTNSIENITDELIAYKPLKDECRIGRLECLSNVIHAATVMKADVQYYHQKIFPILMQNIMPSTDESGEQIIHYTMQQLGDAADSVSIYTKAYIKFVNQSGDRSSFEATVCKLFEGCEYLINHSQEIFESEYKALDAADDNDLDDDELAAEAEGLVDEYTQCIENIGYSYASFIMELKDGAADLVEKFIYPVVLKLIERGTDNAPALITTVQGIAICADISEFMAPQYAIQYVQPLLAKFKTILREKIDDFTLVQACYYTLSQYLQKTNDNQVAQDAEMLTFSAGLLQQLVQDGSDEALSAFDNVCTFMCYMGQFGNQSPEFWQAMFIYIEQMRTDFMEIRSVLRFLLKQQNIPAFQNLGNLLTKSVCLLFFGLFYAELVKPEEEDPEELVKQQELMQLVGQFLQSRQQQVAQIVQSSKNNFVMKNFQLHFAK